MDDAQSVVIDRDRWSGEGTFAQKLVDWFASVPEIAFVRVEDAAATRSDVDYNFTGSEIFLRFHTRDRIERRRLWGIVPISQTVSEKLMTIERLESALAGEPEIGQPDYADEAMIQYLRTERIIPPYQTKGYKLIELVRIYEVGTAQLEQRALTSDDRHG